MARKVKITKSSSLEFLEKFLVFSFVLSDAEGKTSGPLNRTGIVDVNTFLSTLLAIHQKFREPSVWEVMESSCFIGK